MKMNKKVHSPIVAIHCMVYNHEPYLRQCLDGFVMQQTDFPFIAIVHDDASTDYSADIIREYEQKYPTIIRPIYETANQYSKPGAIARIMMEASKDAKYIAFCEGDDYWTDALKLQKQVDFLESHPDYVFCCHRFKIYEQDHNLYRKEYGYTLYKDEKDLEITEEIFFKAWITQPLTAMFRAVAYKTSMQKCIESYLSIRDNYLFYEMLQLGRGISLNQFMGIYRWHKGGVDTGTGRVRKSEINLGIFKNLYTKHTQDKNLLVQLEIAYNRFLLFHTPLKNDNLKLLKEALLYSTTVKLKLKMIFAYIVPPQIGLCLHIINIQLLRYKKMSIIK